MNRNERNKSNIINNMKYEAQSDKIKENKNTIRAI